MLSTNVRVKLACAVAAALASALLCGCGGGGGASTGEIVIEQPSYALGADRSIRANNYNNRNPFCDTGAEQAIILEILALHSNLTFGENWEGHWVQPAITPAAVKALNPNCKIYRSYDLMCKSDADTDWDNPADTSMMGFPITRAEIDANDWWLRDANGDIVKEGATVWYVDVGKPGVKELYLQRILERNTGEGFDGILFDIWNRNFVRLSRVTGAVLPMQGYATDADWFTNAWQPFITYVTDGLHAAGHKIVGNEAGRWNTGDPTVEFHRSKLDGVVYERWMLAYADLGGGWLPGDTVEYQISAMQNDPLDMWISENSLVIGVDDYEQKRLVSLAGYYIAVPLDDSKRSYTYARNGNTFWDQLWNLYIGDPTETAVKISGKYFWSRKYTQGIVILNYQESETVSFRLDRTYRDNTGKTYSGTISVPAHTGLVLATIQ